MTLEISAAGMRAAELRQRATANNVANANTPGYQAQRVELQAQTGGGVRAGEATPSGLPAPPGTSNVNLASEFVTQTADVRALQANANAFRAQADLLGELIGLAE